MIAPLRRRHRRMTATLLVAVPVLLVLALAARPAPPWVASLPAALASGPGTHGADVETREVFGGLGVTVRSWWTAQGTVIGITPAEPLARPGVLVYWTSSPAADRLPDGAVLLGAVADRGRTYLVPPSVASRDGYLVLYSLGHQEVVASGALPALGNPHPQPLSQGERGAAAGDPSFSPSPPGRGGRGVRVPSEEAP